MKFFMMFVGSNSLFEEIDINYSSVFLTSGSCHIPLIHQTFHEILELEEKAIITDEFSDISNNDMHIIEAIGLGDGARMSVVAKRLNITVGSLTYPLNLYFA